MKYNFKVLQSQCTLKLKNVMMMTLFSHFYPLHMCHITVYYYEVDCYIRH